MVFRERIRMHKGLVRSMMCRVFRELQRVWSSQRKEDGR